MWDICLINEKDSSSFNQNDLSLFYSAITISSDGTIKFGREISSTVQCPMDLRTYPHDVQNCNMTFMSYQRAIEEMQLNTRVHLWDDSLQSSAFHLINVSSAETSVNINGTIFSRANVMIELKRELSNYIFQVFISNRRILLSIMSIWFLLLI